MCQDGSLLVTLVPSNLPMTTVVGLYSLRRESLGDCHATYSLESSAVSVSLSPTSRHLLVGLTSRLDPQSAHTFGWFTVHRFNIEQGTCACYLLWNRSS